MKFQLKRFRVPEGKKLDLHEWPTAIDPFYPSKDDYKKLLAEHVDKLSSLQKLHYASGKHAVLLICQAMDAAGKDGAIRHVRSGVNPQGCQVFSFKHPSATELQHDFLWRTTRDLPERGRIGIFNRSYYEQVLVLRVHRDILQSENIPDLPHGDTNGTRIMKFFLHFSKDEQRNRFLSRIDEPDKHWKVSEADIEERKFWKQYRHAYEECLSATSMDESPWFVVPADYKENARLIVSQIVVETLDSLGMSYPEVTAERKKQLQATRAELAK